jgi:hyaluronoglucosaminidase
VAWDTRGLIEGFYGPPWSWDARVDVMRWCHDRSMTTYVYAPKDDPKHRARWRDPYDDAELDGFRRLVDEGGLVLGFAISPGLSIDAHDEDDRRELLAKAVQVLDVGSRLVCLALDDIPPRPGLGDDHAALVTWLHGALEGRAPLVFVPTEYTGTGARTPYLDAVADGVPEDVPIAWTGRRVVNDAITEDEARQRAEAVGGRPPLIWDNNPVNDAFMADRLFLGPLRGRDPGLADACCGYLANPMVQPRASRPALASAAGYLEGTDPEEAWAADIGELRVFAEACDGVVPQKLVGEAITTGDTVALRRWLEAAAVCGAPGLDGEAERWLEAAHAEASLGLTALAVLDALAGESDLARATEQALALAFGWPSVRRGAVTVMGPRLSFRPVLGQRADGTWLLDPAARQEGQNAIDRLAAHALDTLAAAEPVSRP